jgi:hypothetical protein
MSRDTKDRKDDRDDKDSRMPALVRSFFLLSLPSLSSLRSFFLGFP